MSARTNTTEATPAPAAVARSTREGEIRTLRLAVALYLVVFTIKLGAYVATGVMALLAEAFHIHIDPARERPVVAHDALTAAPSTAAPIFLRAPWVPHASSPAVGDTQAGSSCAPSSTSPRLRASAWDAGAPALPAASIIVIRHDRATKGRPFEGAPWRQ
jgi:hypothetical protein